MSSATLRLVNFNKYLQSKPEPDQLLEGTVKNAVMIANASYAILALYDNLTNELYYRINTCQASAVIQEDFFRFKIDEGIVGYCARNHQIINIENVATDEHFIPEIDNRCAEKMKSVLAVPMLAYGKLIGVLAVVNSKRNCFTKHHEHLIYTLASLAAFGLEHIRLTEELINQSRLSRLGQNIANSAHGIKNILNNLDGGTFIVERGVSSQNMQAVDKGWDIMKRNSNRLRELVLDMLLFSRPKKPEYKNSDINKICTDIVELIRENAEQQNVKIFLDLQKEITSVFIDPKGIYRCILNLVSNAIQACQGKNDVYVKISTRYIRDNKHLEIKIEDTGSGISEENLEHIFDIFFTTKGSKGTGLGLPVTKKIINEHKGSIDVVSMLDKGTSFTIQIPI